MFQKKKLKLRQLIRLIEVSAYVCFGFSLSLLYASHQLNNSVLPESNNLQTASVGVDKFKNADSIVPHNVIIAKTTTSIPTKQNYAYLWTIGDIHEDKPSYKGFLWDVLISANILRKQGSKADFWLYYRLSPDSKLFKMPTEQLGFLSLAGIRVRQLPKPEMESFGQLVFDKFLALNMTDYKRVMFLDTDIIPLVNLDYYFHLSDPAYTALPTVLKPNFMMATLTQPCYNGMFFMEPSADHYHDAMRARFSQKDDWGHDFLEMGDKWESLKKTGTKWNFLGAHSDQGLMYYVAKYIKKDLSIAFDDRILNWRAVEGQVMPETEADTTGILTEYQPEVITYQYSCDADQTPKQEVNDKWHCNPPYNSIAHFHGKAKPWLDKFSMENINLSWTYKQRAVKSLWFQELDELNKKYEMDLDLTRWNKKHLPDMKAPPLDHGAKTRGKKTVINGNTKSLTRKKRVKSKEVIMPAPQYIHKRISTSSSYAYLWIVGGIHEDKPSYKGFIWDVLISASILRKQGSKADFWLYYRLSPDSSLDIMPSELLDFLNASGIRVKQLPKPEVESFGQLVFDKFLTFNMTDYKRVMFLDADTIPMTNLDYYFHLSDPAYTDLPTVLKPNFIVATLAEPCNTAMFFVEPSSDTFMKYHETVRLQHEKAKELPYPHFSKHSGWGHAFREHHDHWEAVTEKAGNWNFWAAHSDQGLMYYVAKYIKKDLSIAIGDRIQNWKAVEGQYMPEIESDITGVLIKYQPKLLAYQNSCNAVPTPVDEVKFHWKCTPPYDSFAHFYGKFKPWQSKYMIKDITQTREYKQKAAKSIWFRELNELNDKFNMGLVLTRWNKKHLPEMKRSSLGYVALYSDRKDIIDGNVHDLSGYAK